MFAAGLAIPKPTSTQTPARGADVIPAARELARVVGHAVSPYDFGAVGDGLTDDTSACNAAASHARTLGASLVFPPGVFAISEYIVVHAGVPQVLGRGGIIRCINTTRDAGVLLLADQAGRKMSGCRVESLLIDCNQVRSASTNAIFGQGIDACELIGNRVTGLSRGYGILVRAMADAHADCAGNRIIDNVIEADTAARPACTGIGVDAILSFLPGYPDAPSEWRAHHRSATPYASSRDNVVMGNRVTGGYYGLSLSATSHSEVRRNSLAHNVRNISVQNGCAGNVISDNECLQSLSSGIHLAYGSNNNTITGNRVRSDRAVGEGLLQAYVGATNNLFEGNSTEAVTPASPKYHCYIAVHADDNAFLNNRLLGTCSRAYVAIESAFNPASNDPIHRNFKLEASTGHFAAAGMSGVVVKGNLIGAQSSVPALYLAQIADDRGSYPLRGCVLADNVIVSTASGLSLKLVEDTPGQLSQLVLERNSFPPDGSHDGFIVPGGTAHFMRIRNNIGLHLIDDAMREPTPDQS